MNSPLKASIRKEKITLRQEMPEAQRTEFSERICERIKPHLEKDSGAIALYHPVRAEVDIFSYCSDGNICLPAVTSGSRVLVFRKISRGQKLEASVYGTLQPDATCTACLPDVVIVPTVAFDRRGFRIGYGGGYYDATLTDLRSRKNITAIGVAFSMQEIPEVPAEAFDSRLNLIITEKEILDFQ